MARGKKRVNQISVMNRRIKQGRGQGQGKKYQPWLRVQDGPSEGFLIRNLGWTTGRVHHLLSMLEDSYFCLLDWSKDVVDIREQYPLLPLRRTLEIADRLGIKHPCHPQTKQPIVMTTDFLIDVQTSEGIKTLARTVKPADKLTSVRVIEKFEIERTFWAEQGIDWGIVTEREINKYSTLANNVRVLHKSWDTDNLPLQAMEHLHKIERLLYEQVSVRQVPPARSAGYVDDQLGLKPGSALSAFKHFLARRIWHVDMKKTLDFSRPMIVKRNPKRVPQ